eukprot:TRINITY_DN4686_c0_g2_i1.p1 TRINITY_DN4686_c0_g2~~TRINITY_DN4686_c0_g2_i1.p1  ORF type:complete len:109 (-),score=1.34 TRINITY_DN4686_c0_g2_i1:122-448(-)
MIASIFPSFCKDGHSTHTLQPCGDQAPSTIYRIPSPIKSTRSHSSSMPYYTYKAMRAGYLVPIFTEQAKGRSSRPFPFAQVGCKSTPSWLGDERGRVSQGEKAEEQRR